MRKFIISDIHGNGNIYYSIMTYLDNISKKEKIVLYINGDLIDRGYESAEILLDVKKRMESNNFLKILTFNNNNEIIYGNYFKDYKNIFMTEEELNKDRSFLNKEIKIKKLIKNEDGVTYYKQ